MIDPYPSVEKQESVTPVVRVRFHTSFYPTRLFTRRENPATNWDGDANFPDDCLEQAIKRANESLLDCDCSVEKCLASPPLS